MKKVGKNPIREFVDELLASGKTTKERICVAADLKYDTFNNMFVRPTVSMMVRKSLLFSGILPKRKYDEYEIWLRDVYKPSQKTQKTETRSRNRHTKQAERTKEASD